MMKLGPMRVAIPFLLFALIEFSVVGSRPPAHPASFTLPFELVDNRVFIEVRLNGHGPYHFILDTGARGTISDHVAQELGLKLEDAGLGQGVGAEKFHYGRAQVAEVQIGDLNLTNVEFNVMSFADSAQLFGVKPEDGIIGRPVFDLMAVKHCLLTFTQPEDSVDRGPGTEVDFERPNPIPAVARAFFAS